MMAAAATGALPAGRGAAGRSVSFRAISCR